MYRVGKKQKLAVLSEDGKEIVMFKKGEEAVAQKFCDLLNAGQVAPTAEITYTSDTNEFKLFIKGITFFAFKRKDYKAFQSWQESGLKGMHYIEVYLGGDYMTLEIESKSLWIKIIQILTDTF